MEHLLVLSLRHQGSSCNYPMHPVAIKRKHLRMPPRTSATDQHPEQQARHCSERGRNVRVLTPSRLYHNNSNNKNVRTTHRLQLHQTFRRSIHQFPRISSKKQTSYFIRIHRKMSASQRTGEYLTTVLGKRMEKLVS